MTFRPLRLEHMPLAVADGLVVYTSESMTCNLTQPGCPDYSPTGCPGFYLGNQVIIQHADGTYSAFSHLQTNSIQVAVGTSVCQGLYVARQGHIGTTSGPFNSCGDHLHVQRQISPDPSGQSIPLTFSDVAFIRCRADRRITHPVPRLPIRSQRRRKVSRSRAERER